MERGLKFHELSEMGRQAFLDYGIPIVTVSGAENVDSGSIYRRLNCQEPLTWAEKLYSYSQLSPEFEADMRDLTIWNMFARRSDRKQIFQMCVMCHMIEASGSGIKNTTLPTAALEVGTHVSNIALRKQVSRNLTLLAHMFHGLTFTAMGEIIPLYQAIHFLQMNNANLMQSEVGCLTKWYIPLREISLARERRRRTKDGPVSVYELADTPAQISFWAENLKALLSTEGVILKDLRRTFTMVDKLKLLDVQHGRCATCEKVIDITSDADHILPHAVGGLTELSNGQVLCRSCHGKKTTAQASSSNTFDALTNP